MAKLYPRGGVRKRAHAVACVFGMLFCAAVRIRRTRRAQSVARTRASGISLCALGLLSTV